MIKDVLVDSQFNITINYGHKGLEWRPTIGPDTPEQYPLGAQLSSWERAMLRALVEEFNRWLKEQGI